MDRARENGRRAPLFIVMIVAGCARAVSDTEEPAAGDSSTDALVASHDGGNGGGGGDDSGSGVDTSTGGGDTDTTVWQQDTSLPPPPSACTGKSRVMTTADLFIYDFESGSIGGWYDYNASGALNALAVGAPGAVGTLHAGHLAATGLSSFGGGMGFGTGCWDTSALDGISFWAKGTAGGDNKIQFQVAIPATHAAANGGDCLVKCFDHPSKQLVLTSTWTQYVVSFNELTQAGFGAPAHYTGVIMALNWVSVDANAVDFWVDEIALYKGTAGTGAVGHGGNPPVDAASAD